jgi:type I restriction enzyme R subunit
LASPDKQSLSERDICTKFITPAIQQAGWTLQQFREEVKITDGRVVVRGNLAARVKNPDAKGGPRRADYVLYAQPYIPLAVIEAKQAKFPVGHGMQQALAYAEMLDAPLDISSNGEGFLRLCCRNCFRSYNPTFSSVSSLRESYS